ncbi:MAG: S-methyl-5-thioribose-1-phosphate isomerase [Saccharospirillum sp.]
MPELTATSVRYGAEGLSILDQRRLPAYEVWHHCETPDQLIGHIHSLAVRGAPLIGLAAALMVAWRARQGITGERLLAELERLRAARPTAVNLMNYLDWLKASIQTGHSAEHIEHQAEALFHEDRALCQRMADHAQPLITPGARILTHCNTGALATAGIGTALGVITEAYRLGKGVSVWVDETRPLLQGGRLTAWELSQAGVPYRLICDNMAASLMGKGEVDLVLVGADRIARNGDFANKVGTYSLAVLARAHAVPFYVVAPVTTVDLTCPNGEAIPIEQRAADEVRGVCLPEHNLIWSPDNAEVYNPAFDVTPAHLISGWVLDTGVMHEVFIPSQAGAA